jgi:hypothetical protein
MAKPTILFVPGAWHSPTHLQTIRSTIEQHGYETQGVALPSVDPVDAANFTVDQDVEAISTGIQNILSQGKDVVLVTHSYSGVPGQAAAYSFIPKDNHTGPRLKAIAMMCSFLLPPKTSLLSVMPGGKPAPIHTLSENDTIVTVGDKGPKHYFYDDLSADEASQCTALLKPAAWQSCTTTPSAQGSGYFGVPTSYLVCEKDNAIPAGLQRMMIAGADQALQDRGSDSRLRVETVDCGHSPFLKMPERTSDFIRRSAGEAVPMR